MNKGAMLNNNKTKIEGHLEEVKELLVPRRYKPSPGYLLIGDWTENYHVWPTHIPSTDYLLEDDPYLM